MPYLHTNLPGVSHATGFAGVERGSTSVEVERCTTVSMIRYHSDRERPCDAATVSCLKRFCTVDTVLEHRP